MIVEIPKKTKKRGGFALVAEYNRDLLVLRVKSTWEKTFNLANPKHPEVEMEMTASQCPWCQNPVFKFVISWPYGERPSQSEAIWVVHEVLREASAFCRHSDGSPVDLTEFQLMINAHDNTDHFHVHGLLNAVHPVTHRAVEMNRGYDQILFQHSLRIVEQRLAWSLVPTNPQYEPDMERNLVVSRKNPMREMPLSRGQSAFHVYRGEKPPEIALRRTLHGISPVTLGTAQAVDRFLQSRSIHYHTVERSAHGDAHLRAFFTLDGHRIPSSRIRDDSGRSCWTPTALRKVLPGLPPAFELGYPLSKMRQRRKRKSKKTAEQEWQVIADELKKKGRADIHAGRRVFTGLNAEHFIIHAELPNSEFRYRPNPTDRAMPSGQIDRFPVSSLDALKDVALQLRVAEDGGARIKFHPVREGIVYAAAIELDVSQLAILKQEYSTALTVKDPGGSYAVLLAMKALPDHDICMAALRLFNTELHARFHTGGLPPPPVFALAMPGFRSTLGEWLPGDPPVTQVELVGANPKTCAAASKRLVALGRHYTEVILPARGTLFAVALRKLAMIPARNHPDSQLAAMTKAHLMDLQATATPPANWEEVDRCLAMRLRLAGANDSSVVNFMTKFATLTRAAGELPVPCVEYAKAIARWTMTTSDISERLVDMAAQWRAMAGHALEAWLAEEAVPPGQASRIQINNPVKTRVPLHVAKPLAGENLHDDPDAGYGRPTRGRSRTH